MFKKSEEWIFKNTANVWTEVLANKESFLIISQMRILNSKFNRNCKKIKGVLDWFASINQVLVDEGIFNDN